MTSVCMLVASCSGEKQENSQAGDSQLAGSVKIDGSSTVYPITEAVAEDFRNEQPEVRVTVGVSGTGGGFKKFCRGETDINDASRPIKDKEVELCKENNIEYVSLAIAYDGLAVVVNPANDWMNDITVEELKKLWEPAAQGVITKWSQVRAGWPDEEIHLFGPGVASGTYDYFTEAIVGESGSSRGDFTASEDDNVLVQGIASDKFAIGFFGLAYYEENQDKLKLAGVSDNGAPAVKPNMETVSSGTYAPLSRPIFIYVSSAAAQRPEVRAFVDFYLEQAPEISKEVGYIPLPQADYEKARTDFANFKPATANPQ
ncbi:MAG: PstS family phosphate ABC transporter substrate-binding protein [Flavobacteriales bacterium]|nr:PstS family phosphate ABC transporter substrate-binding protein [Flavobacteriales bacterium]MCB9446844.1 PstS family phosphate ABC transporter substrate-binding protein [Flavobacteriales bacterium]